MKIYDEEEQRIIMAYRQARQRVDRSRTVESFLVKVPRVGRVAIYDIRPMPEAVKLTGAASTR